MSDASFMTEVTQPILIKDGALFFGIWPNGAAPDGGDADVGLFHRDPRYLSGYDLTLGGRNPLFLMSSAARGTQAIHQLTNDEVVQTDSRPLALQSFGLGPRRTVAGDRLELTDRIEIRNFALKPIRFELAVTVDALFGDIFELRGAEPKSGGSLRPVSSGLALDNPLLPTGVACLEVVGLTVGPRRFDCRVTRDAAGVVSGSVTPAEERAA